MKHAIARFARSLEWLSLVLLLLPLIAMQPDPARADSDSAKAVSLYISAAVQFAGVPIPPEHQKHIGQYTTDLGAALAKVAQAALDDRKPGQIAS